MPQRRQVPLLDLNAVHRPIREEILAAITRVVDAGRFILGDEVAALEREVAAYTGVPYAVGCASGSDALYLALRAVGVTHGDVVLTTPFSFFATAGAISHTGAAPVFIDIDPQTFNLDPERLRATLQRHPHAKAIVPVHLFGGCADMDPILELARQHGCVVIEDGAQAIGAEYKGRRAQSLGDLGCLSFFPSKNLGGLGDGGMVTTHDAQLAQRLATLRVHGAAKKYDHTWIGVNSRLDALQAAVLRVKLPHLDAWTAARQRNAALYREILGRLDLPLTLSPLVAYQTRHIYNQFVVRTTRRDALMAHLQRNGIGTEVYYPRPLHLQTCYQSLGYRAGDFPESERAASEVLSLPIYPGLQPDDIAYVCDCIESFYHGHTP